MIYLSKLSLTICLLCSICLSCSNQNINNYSFFVAGHVYGTPGNPICGIHPPFKRKLNEYIKMQPFDFGVFTGDIVISGTEDQWNCIERDIAELKTKVYFAAGNHDMINRPLFEQRYGKTYYSFNYHNDLFLILDPNIDHWNISGNQLLFLQDEIIEYKNNGNIFIFFHEVLWWDKNNKYNDEIIMNSIYDRAENINFWSVIIPILEHSEKQVYLFAGDVGATSISTAFYYDKHANIHLLASGMGNIDTENFLNVKVMEKGKVFIEAIELNTNKTYKLL